MSHDDYGLTDWPRLTTFMDSSHIYLAAFDPSASKLMIEFGNGDRYLYQGVSLVEYGELVSAISVGKYFNLYIKDEYPFKKMENK